MEHAAELFIFNSWENEEGATAPEVIHEDEAAAGPSTVGAASGPVGGGWAQTS